MTLVVFIGLHAIGNPADILIGEDLNQQERLEASARLGLDRPLWQQYLAFVEGALHGHLGRSSVYQEDAVRPILQRLPATLESDVAQIPLFHDQNIWAAKKGLKIEPLLSDRTTAMQITRVDK